MPGRFFLGVGTGENLNEHILGDRWPSAPERREMLEEAMVLRLLWQGGEQSYRGRHYTVDHARIYDVPNPLPPIYVAASGELAAQLAAHLGDGLVSVGPSAEVVKAYRAAGGTGRAMARSTSAGRPATPRRAAWAASGGRTRRSRRVSQELPLPRHFEQATQDVTEDDVRRRSSAAPIPRCTWPSCKS